MSAIENEVSCPPWLPLAIGLSAQRVKDAVAKRFPAWLLALLVSAKNADPHKALIVAFRVLYMPLDEEALVAKPNA